MNPTSSCPECGAAIAADDDEVRGVGGSCVTEHGRRRGLVPTAVSAELYAARDALIWNQPAVTVTLSGTWAPCASCGLNVRDMDAWATFELATGRTVRTCLKPECRAWALGHDVNETPPREAAHTLVMEAFMIDGEPLRDLLQCDKENCQGDRRTMHGVSTWRLTPAQRDAVRAHWSADLRERIASKAPRKPTLSEEREAAGHGSWSIWSSHHPSMQPGNTTYLDRKLEGLCTYPGCSSAPVPGVQLCHRHRRKQNRRQRASANKLRNERRKRGLCAAAGCGEKSSTYYCVKHAINLGRTVSAATHNTVDKSARLAARTRVEDGRTRYHGQPRRGSQPIGQLEAKELDDAIALLRTAKEGLAMARAAPLSKVQRRAALHASVAHADRVARMIAELCERLGYAQQALVHDTE